MGSALFEYRTGRKLAPIARRATRKLEAIYIAIRLDDLMVPPPNRLEKLKGDLRDFYSIRINDQWCAIFYCAMGMHSICGSWATARSSG